jgi:hypothetical protein
MRKVIKGNVTKQTELQTLNLSLKAIGGALESIVHYASKAKKKGEIS